MKKLIFVLLVGFVTTAQSAEFNTMDDCLNAYGKTWAKMRQSYCNEPGRVGTDEFDIDAAINSVLDEYAEKALAQAKADGMTCAKRYKGNKPIVKCRDEVGEFQLRY